jgi:hypothetical protein
VNYFSLLGPVLAAPYVKHQAIGLLRCDIMLLGKWFPILQRIIVPSSSGIQSPNGIRFQKNESSTALLWEPEILFINTLATGYGDFCTSVASGRRRATEISVFAYGWMEEGFGLCCVLAFVVIQP